MEAYKTWVRRNKDYVHPLDSLANGLTWVLPELLSDSEIGTEAVSSIVGILTTINEHIIDTAPDERHTGSADPSSFPYGLCLSMLSNLETLVEVVAEQYYGDKKWNFIAVTEAIKVMVRLALFRNCGYKMLLQGGETPNVEKDSEDISLQHTIGGFQKLGGRHGPGWLQDNHGQNRWNVEGRTLSALIRFGESALMVSDLSWMQRIKHAIMDPPTSVIERPTLSRILSEKGVNGALFVLGEVLFITRPLIYVLFIRRYRIRSWIPWCLSLAVDFIGVGFLSHVTRSGKSGKEQWFHLSESEHDEVKRRKLLWALYLMRDPFFSKYIRQKIESTGKLFEPVPLMGTLAEKIVELIIGVQTRYTYMSGS
ncbi:PEROXIN 16, SHRUNKEN SEED 1, ARABIDOPSIS PEROXIN 16 [Hibiscus trionum]|uniref:Peroxisomal membrane protein PEX16 n=1 Tax=Hibiscus trionum TaxID=183268 RepID=A0A9W7GWJ8_HIBTR|nr:PEROXIN 16, SHRUNKEN SEED 1, ARABIDOPSIS PEROXIN 16 [Hibiscus trionum]